MFESLSVIVAIAALFSVINHSWLKLPTTIGLMLLAFFLSLAVIGISALYPPIYDFFCQVIVDADFKSILMDSMLSFLLFAGAMHVDMKKLLEERMAIILFATVGVILSTAIVGGLIFLACQMIGVHIPLLYSLLLGALISPTDPIAVLSILKGANVSESLMIKIEGESLFNDGIGVVVFLGILSMIEGQTGYSTHGGLLEIFLKEAVGGFAFGAILGFTGFYLLKRVDDDAKVCVLVTLAIVMGGYALSSLIGVSGPLAMVVSGLWIGNQMYRTSFSERTYHFIENFWEMLDNVLNAILFVLIGLVVHTLEFEPWFLALGLFLIIAGLLARFLSVGAIFTFIRSKGESWLNWTTVLTWGGLRGGISVALALSLPDFAFRDTFVFMTYTVVIFSIIVQGLTIGRIVKKWMI